MQPCRDLFSIHKMNFNCLPMLGMDRRIFKYIRGLWALKSVAFCCLVVAQSATLTAAPVYAPPATHRVDVNLDEGWRFIRMDVEGAPAARFDDASWESINLPHTWNNLDGQDGGTNYYRGPGWYRKRYTIDRAYEGRRLFLKFDGAFSASEVWVNGIRIGEHRGGFAAFVFDATGALRFGAENVIAVKVSNVFDPDIPPLSADFLSIKARRLAILPRPANSRG